MNVIFTGNTGSTYGGGVGNDEESSPTFTNVTFYGNTASFGAGISNRGNSNPTVTNATFTENYASAKGGAVYSNGSHLNMSSSIFWENWPDQFEYNVSSTITVSYSDVQGGWAGIGNIDKDPLLGPLADNGGFTLTHALGAGSPAIDAGDPLNCPATDQRGFPRPIDGDGLNGPRCDMGAYEYGSQGFFLYLPFMLK